MERTSDPRTPTQRAKALLNAMEEKGWWYADYDIFLIELIEEIEATTRRRQVKLRRRRARALSRRPPPGTRLNRDPICESCRHQLCHLERTWDDCVSCGHPLPDSVKLDFDLQPYPSSPTLP